MSKPKILVARAVFPAIIELLQQHFDVEHNQADATWTKGDFIARLQGKAGVFTTGGERIDGPVLELASPAGLFSAMLRPAGDDLHIRASAGSLEVFSLIQDGDRG